MHIATKFLPLHIPINSYPKNPIFLCGFNFLKANNNSNEGFGLKRNMSVCAVDKDPEFEVDPIKAREALRKLDDQIQTNLQPKIIRGAVDVDLDNESNGSFMENEKEESLEIPGSLLASLASALVIFSIFYNVIFITVIRPSIDNAP